MLFLKKEGFLDYKNVISTFFQRGWPMIFVNNSKFLSSLLFFQKGQDMYFYEVIYKKKAF